MANKLPSIQFYTGDWLKDPRLSMCSAMTRGIWIDFLCAMHELDRVGELRGTTEQLARVARCSPVEIAQALDELSASRTADVSERNGFFTVVNRRMKREYEDREANKTYVRNYREKENVRNGKANVRIPEIVKNKGDSAVNGNGKANVSSYSSSSSSNTVFPNVKNCIENGSGGGEFSAPVRGELPTAAANRQWSELTDEEKQMSEAEFATHLQKLNPKKNVRRIAGKVAEFCKKHGKSFALERVKGWVEGEHGAVDEADFLAALGGDEVQKSARQIAIENCTVCDERGMVKIDGKFKECRHKEQK